MNNVTDQQRGAAALQLKAAIQNLDSLAVTEALGGRHGLDEALRQNARSAIQALQTMLLNEIES